MFHEVENYSVGVQLRRRRTVVDNRVGEEVKLAPTSYYECIYSHSPPLHSSSKAYRWDIGAVSGGWRGRYA